ncbi:hypothetical protein K505DRAFT_77275 [Melanomma pulvis-pyrius CBS 109.77]|uniref:Uncharacterized protein n=1 Tax=Melanomma pulvis-pyrius CBS 109.77 TaxID=1314802 RepID=A0A6A6X2Q8_9PLEO|nr:hypothetical protein K505DRAFT_77275 [Melanomma pulvis-pyrius CBS 109.77]
MQIRYSNVPPNWSSHHIYYLHIHCPRAWAAALLPTTFQPITPCHAPYIHESKDLSRRVDVSMMRALYRSAYLRCNICIYMIQQRGSTCDTSPLLSSLSLNLGIAFSSLCMRCTQSSLHVPCIHKAACGACATVAACLGRSICEEGWTPGSGLHKQSQSLVLVLRTDCCWIEAYMLGKRQDWRCWPSTLEDSPVSPLAFLNLYARHFLPNYFQFYVSRPYCIYLFPR